MKNLFVMMMLVSFARANELPCEIQQQENLLKQIQKSLVEKRKQEKARPPIPRKETPTKKQLQF